MSVQRFIAAIAITFLNSFLIASVPDWDILLNRDFVVSRFGMTEGLPQSSVNDLIQSQDGFIWLATYGGLVRFDGHSFKTYDRFNTPGMNSDRILNLYEDKQGAIWLGTENGFIRFHKDSCRTYFITQDSQVFSPLMVREDDRGTLWVSAGAVIYRFENDQFVQVNPVSGSTEKKTALKNSAGVWLAHHQDVFRTSGDSLILIHSLKAKLKNQIQDIIEFPRGSDTLFLGTDGDGVIRLTSDGMKAFTGASGLHSPFVKKFYVDKRSRLWVTTYNGIAKWDGRGFEKLTRDILIGPHQYNRILQDNEGNYWIGTPDEGLIKLKPAVIETLGKADGLETTNMLSLVRLSDGSILMATNCGGVFEWSKGKITRPKVNDFLPNLCIWSVFQDSKGAIWFGSRGLYRTNDLKKPGVYIDESKGFTGGETFAITEAPDGTMWIGCLNGLFQWNGRDFKRFSTADGLWYNDTRSLLWDGSDSLWIGTTSGLNRFVNGKIEKIHLSENGQQEPYIRAIFKEPDGCLWLGTYGNGLIRLKNGNLSRITTRHGLPDNTVSHFIPDSLGNVWMGSNRGIHRVKLTELHQFCDGQVDQVFSESFGLTDGMLSAETNGGFQPSFVKFPDGKIFFPTINGVASVNPSKVKKVRTPPPVYIEFLTAGDRQLTPDRNLYLNYDSTSLTIHFTAITFRNPEKVKFRYLLEGYMNEWQETEHRSVSFSRLPSGEFTFRVTARVNEAGWNPNESQLTIQVKPPFWQTTFFYIVIGLFFLVTGPAIFFIQVSRLNREKKRQERFSQQLIDSQESERRRIAAELHDGLGQQILIMKNRADIALAQKQLPEIVSDQLQEIRQSAIASIQDVRQISQALRPVHLEQFGLRESLNVLCDQIAKTSTIEWSYYIDEVDGVLPREKEINLYRIIQEATNNVLKHSLATEASVTVKKIQRDIKIKIWDDGVGFNPDSKPDSVGLGLSGMKERTKAFTGGVIDIKSAPGEGTTLKIIIPIR